MIPEWPLHPLVPRRDVPLNDNFGLGGDFQVDGAKNFQTLNIGGSGTTSCSFIIGV